MTMKRLRDSSARSKGLAIQTAWLISLILAVRSVVCIAAEGEPKRVFVLNSFHRGYAWTDNMLRGIDDAFEKSGIKVETYVTFMDMKRVSATPEQLLYLRNEIKEAYKRTRFDAVLACDNDALVFMRKYRDDLFPGTPVVFAAINDYDERMLDGRKDITGTSENTDYAETLRVAFKLRLATRNVVVVTDNTTTGKAHRSAVEKIRPGFSGKIGFTYVSLADMTIEELAQKLSKLDRRNVVLLLHHFVDKNGTAHTVQTSTPLLAKSASVPCFVVSDIRMGLGVLGGKVVSGYRHGEIAAGMVVRILNGTDIGAIPVVLNSPNAFMFDYNAMKRFGIAESDLPQESVVINRIPSALEKHRNVLLAFLAIIAALCGILAYLVRENRVRRRNEAAIRASDEMFRRLFVQSPVGAVMVGRDYRFLKCNEAFCIFVGYGEGELIGQKTFLDITFPEDRAKGLGEIQAILRKELDLAQVEKRYVRKDGGIVWGQTNIRAIQNQDGAPVLLAIVQDITERKAAEDAVRDREGRLHAVAAGTPDHIALQDRDLRYRLVINPHLGLTEADMIGKTDDELFEKEDVEKVDALKKSVLETGKPARAEMSLRNRKGEEEFFSGTYVPRFDATGRPDGVIAYLRNITERKHAEDALRAAEVRLKEAVAAGDVGLWDWDLHTNQVFYSTEWKRQIGYADAEVTNDFSEWQSRVHPEDLDATIRKVRDFIEGRSASHEVEFRFRHKNGSYRWILARAALVAEGQGKPKRLVGSHVDITEQKRLESALRASEEKFRRLFSEMSVGCALHQIVLDPAGKAVDYVTLEVNEAFERILGANRADVVGRRASEILPVAELSQWLEIFGPVALTGKSTSYEQYSPLNGKWFEGSVYSPEPGRFAGTFMDVTDRKRAETSLRTVHEQLVLAKQAANAGIWNWDMSSGELVWSVEQYRLFGIDPEREKATFDAWRRVLHPSDREMAEERVREAVQNRERLESDYRIILPSGEIRWIHATGKAMYDEAGRPVHMAGICLDVTARKCAEAALQESRMLYQSLFSNMLNGFAHCRMLFDDGHPQDFVYLSVNDAFGALTGLTAVVGKRVSEVIPGIHQTNPELLDIYGRVTSTGRAERFETYLPALRQWLSVSVYRPREGEFAAVFEDITERKVLEEALKSSETRYHAIFEQAGDGIFLLNTQGQIVAINGMFEQMHGFSADEVRQLGIAGLDVEGATPVDERMRRLMAGETLHFDVEHRHKDGRTFPVAVTAKLIDSGGEKMVLAIHRDMTAQRQADQALRRSEERYRGLFTCSPAGVCEIDAAELLRLIDATPPKEHGRLVASLKTDGPERVAAIEKIRVLDLNRSARMIFGLPGEGGTVPEAFSAVQRIVAGILLDDVICICKGKPRCAGESPLRNVAGALCHVAWEWNRGPEASGRLIMSLTDVTERRKAEVARRESEANFRAFFESMTDLVFVATREGRVLLANAAASRTLGYSPEVLALMNLSDLYSPEDRREVESNFAATALGEGKVCSLPLLRMDGVLVPVETHVRPGRWNEQECLFAICMDLTSEVEAQQRFERLFRKSPALMAVSDLAERRFIDVNDTFVETLGFRRDEAIGKTVADLGLFPHPEQQNAASEEMRAGGSFRDREMEVRRKDGVVLHGLFSGEIIASQGEQYVLTVMIDITDRKRYEDALRDSENRFRSLVEFAPEGVFVQSDGCFVFANNVMCKLLGAATPETLIGTEFLSRLAPEYHEAARRRIREQIETGMAAPPMEQEYLRLDGVRVPVETTAVPVRFQDRDGHLVLVRDITARKKAEKEKSVLEAQLQQAQKMESVGRLAGGVAHDFNNMLGVIMGHAELAMDRLGTAEPHYADLVEIKKAAERSANLTRQLLAFARKQTVVPKVVDLNAVVESMLKMLQRLIGEDIELQWRPGKDLWPTLMDPSQVDQILANLCVNARDAISGIGTITIETENNSLGEAYCALHAGIVPGDYVRLTVSDSGSGMDKETLAHVFEPFFTTKALGAGTGLGLATVYGAVKQNGGFILVESKPAAGTTFTIHLPRQVSRPSSSQSSEAADPVVRGGETILVVEDESPILELIRTVLEAQGYTVLAAATPGEAIHMAQRHRGEIHLLLTDVVMPEMNGRDLAKNLLSIYPRIKRLFMSGYTADVIAHHGVLNDGMHFIEKPFPGRRLTAKVREVLDR